MLESPASPRRGFRFWRLSFAGNEAIPMNELREQLARLREDAALCEAMSSEATDPDHRQMLARLAAVAETSGGLSPSTKPTLRPHAVPSQDPRWQAMGTRTRLR